MELLPLLPLLHITTHYSPGQLGDEIAAQIKVLCLEQNWIDLTCKQQRQPTKPIQQIIMIKLQNIVVYED